MPFSSYDDDFSILKGVFVAVCLLNNVRFCVFVVFCLHSSRFFRRCCLGFFKMFWRVMAGVWMVFNDHFSILLGLFTCLRW